MEPLAAALPWCPTAFRPSAVSASGHHHMNPPHQPTFYHPTSRKPELAPLTVPGQGPTSTLGKTISSGLGPSQDGLSLFVQRSARANRR